MEKTISKKDNIQSFEKNYRAELKYVINIVEYNIIRNRLNQAINMDSNVNLETRSYNVKSLYFDDQNMSAFHDKINGKRNRFKYRMRVYESNLSNIRLESKVRHDSYVYKEQVKLVKELYYKMINSEVLANEDVKLLLDGNGLDRMTPHIELFINNRVNIYKPVVIINYDREAYSYEFGDVRITFDMNLRYSINSKDIGDPNTVYKNYFDNNEIVMEIKFTKFLPNFLRNLVQVDRYLMTSFSKYSNCLLKLNKYGRKLY